MDKSDPLQTPPSHRFAGIKKWPVMDFSGISLCCDLRLACAVPVDCADCGLSRGYGRAYRL
jgi:hypothetical protein